MLLYMYKIKVPIIEKHKVYTYSRTTWEMESIKIEMKKKQKKTN